jgi:hypothetical protein
MRELDAHENARQEVREECQRNARACRSAIKRGGQPADRKRELRAEARAWDAAAKAVSAVLFGAKP